MPVTEKFYFTGTLSDGVEKTKSRRAVVITGKDCPKFAAVLRDAAAKATAEGDHANALRLQNMARRVEHSRRVTVNIPMDAKLNDIPEKTTIHPSSTKSP